MPPADRSETRQFREYKKKLLALGSDVLPRVIAETINTVAGFAHAQSIRNVRNRFVLRNQYTERSLRYYKANPKADISRINAVTGSVQSYMALQETGGYREPKRGSKAPEATLAARGGDPRKVVRKKYAAGTLGPNQFVGVPRGGNRQYGVYQRVKNNKFLVMIRNISKARIPVDPKHWHTDAVGAYAKRDVLTREFIRQAEAEIKRLASQG